MKSYLAVFALMCVSSTAFADYLCPTWRGTVFQIQQDGTYTLLDNQVLYTFDVSGVEESWTFGSLGDDVAKHETVYVWYFEVAWFGLEDVFPFDCQFTLGYNVDQIFHDEFD